MTLTNSSIEWESFVLNHTKRGNHVFHLVSSLCFFGSPVLAVLNKNPYWLLLFLVSGLIGTAGHFIFRDGSVSARDATVRHRVPWYVLRMFYEIATGKYPHTLQKAESNRAVRLAEGA